MTKYFSQLYSRHKIKALNTKLFLPEPPPSNNKNVTLQAYVSNVLKQQSGLIKILNYYRKIKMIQD